MILYKYAGDTGINVIENLRLKVTPPNEFNDPFELTPRAKFVWKSEEMVERARKDPNYYRCVYENLKGDGYTGTFEEFAAQLPQAIPRRFKEFKGIMRQKLTATDMTSIHKSSQTLGILCLSKPRDSIPMWSHYAKQHEGIAIGLEPDQLPNTLPGHFGKVIYRQRRCPFDWSLKPTTVERHKQTLKALLTKSKVWEYEQEFRRVFPLADLICVRAPSNKRPLYFIDIAAEAVREIVFGCRIDEQYENAIRAELRRRPKTFRHVRLFRCARHRSRFELNIRKC
jgi:hypothetical protein